MAAFNPRAARKARRKVRRLRREVRQYKRQAKADNRYDPLAPLTGRRFRRERSAAERSEFDPRAQELRQAIANQEQTQADRASYYDDYRQALRESTARVNETNRQAVAASQARADQSFAEDSAAVKARDAAQSAQAAKLGRGAVQSNEGARAVEAQRSQANLSTDRLRDRASSDTKYMELRGANSVLAKAEDQDRQSKKREQLRQEEKRLAADRGDFRVNFRRQARQDERQYAAIRKEFGLEKSKFRHQKRMDQQEADNSRSALNTQKIVARIYASADKASARAQIRVAKLQLKKGRISQKQYREIVNIYKGLPGSGKGKNGKAGGDGANLQTWEQDKVELAVRQFEKGNLGRGDRGRAISTAIDKGLPPRLARIAWRRYVNKHLGTRPDTAGNPNVAGE